jgi:Na+/H+ antiporter NhaC/pimeloyl-ACP methyl ester carboxylesterase
LTFRGGTLGALAAFGVFLAGVTALAAAGAPDERGFWPVLLLALITGLLLAQDKSRFAEAMLDGMSQRIVMIMLCAWLFAGVLGSLLAASGFVGALAWAASALKLSGGAYVGAAFVACALIATATGTSFGTILVAGPLLYPAGGAAGAAPAALIGAILAGATWGDSMSPVSDTTIASSGTQGADIGGTVRARLKYAVPAGLAALVASVMLGAADPSVAAAHASAATAAAVTASTGSPLALVMLLVPALVIAMLLAKRHLVESLLVGITTAAIIALAFGLITPSDLLRVEPGSFSATGVILDGFNRAIGVSVFTLLLMGLVGTIQATDLLERLLRSVETRATTARASEWWIVSTVSAAVLLTTHSVVAILMTGPFAKETGERHGISAYRRANLLDLTVCTLPFLLPWFLPTILAASATRDAEALGMPAVSPLAVGMHNTYAWALVISVLLAVVTGFGRRAAVIAVVVGTAAGGSTLGAQSSDVPFSAVLDSSKRAPAADVRITYGPAPSQFAELRLPAGAGPHPVVFLLHGGCWRNAYSVDHVAGIAESLRQRGVAVMAVEYRRVGDEGAGVPGTFDDVRTSYDSLHAIAARYGLDTARVILIGHSAGGQLALWLASEPRIHVRAVVALAAVTDLAAFASPTGCGSAVSRLMGAAADAEPARYAAASPARRPPPPAGTAVLLVSANDDRVVPAAQAEVYRAAVPGITAVGVPGGHFDLVAPWTPAWRQVLELSLALLGEPQD